MGSYTAEEGGKFVGIVRSTMNAYLTTHRFDKAALEKKIHGFNDHENMFVVLYNYPTMETRGCMGIKDAPLRNALVDATIIAISNDPKHIPMSHLELDFVIAEVNILSDMEKIGAGRASEYKIIIGKHGLMLEYGFHSSILLPTYAINNNLTKEQFLDKLCEEAGLDKHTWKKHGIKLYRFTTQTFREIEPEGMVKQVQFRH